MIDRILSLAAESTYDFRLQANPDDPLKYLFDEWMDYYRLKWAIAKTLQPQRILEVGVRYGYSALAFLDACPSAEYVGIDNDSDTFGGHKGAIDWARHATQRFRTKYIIADSQQLAEFPGGCYDLIHIDGQQDGLGSLRDLRKALKQGKHVLVDGYLWTRDNFLNISEFLFRYRDLIESCIIIPGYAGELIITPKQNAGLSAAPSSSSDLRNTYTSEYYLRDCGGYDAFKRDKGIAITDVRLQSVIQLAEIAPPGRALDLGCGRGEISVALAKLGHEVLAVDYSDSAIALAREAAAAADEAGSIRFFTGDVNKAPFEGCYQVIVASDLIEHLAPAELDELYSRISQHMAGDGIFVVHTFPNSWYYRYEYPRRARQARALGAYLPGDPRTRYEELMHINEQSPRVLKSQLGAHFGHVLLWFADHELANPFENLNRCFSRSEMRAAGDLYAIASRSPIAGRELLRKIEMHPLPPSTDIGLQTIAIPSQVAPGSEFVARVRLTNQSSNDLKSRPPYPVNLAYHLYSEKGDLLLFEGRRTPLTFIRPGASADLDVYLTAPWIEGRYLFRLTLVQEGVRWLDDSPSKIFADAPIEVRPA